MIGTGQNRLCKNAASPLQHKQALHISDEPGTPLLERQNHIQGSWETDMLGVYPPPLSFTLIPGGSLALQHFGHLTDGVQHPTLGCGALYL